MEPVVARYGNPVADVVVHPAAGPRLLTRYPGLAMVVRPLANRVLVVWVRDGTVLVLHRPAAPLDDVVRLLYLCWALGYPDTSASRPRTVSARADPNSSNTASASR
jgi:hypothetical protein